MAFKIFQHDRVYNFLGISKFTFTFTITLLIIGIISFAMNGIRYGLDFTGGTLIEVSYDKPADLKQIRAALEAGSFHGAVVQHFGTDRDVLIRMQNEKESPLSEKPATAPATKTGEETGESEQSKLAGKVLAVLRADGSAIDLKRIEYVGPQVGDQLKSQALLAIVLSLMAVTLYLAFRFQLKFSIAAIIALIHDVILVVACFSLFKWEFDLTVLAAVLAIIGYSLNDTIVVFDRIRENIVNMRETDMKELINISVSETLSRTIMTHVTTLISLFALFFAGGESLRGFSVAMIIGVAFGTYSSVYVASSLLPVMKVTKRDLVPPEQEKEQFDTP